MKYSISVICFNRPKLTGRCLGLVLATMPERAAELIITDNGSKPETRGIIAEVAEDERVRVIRNERNLGVILPKNRALRVSHGDFFISLDNDCIPSPGWIERLCAPMLEDRRIAQVGRNGGFRTLNADGVGTVGKRIDYIDGSCFAVRSSVARAIGLCDEVYEIAYCEDSDFSLRLLKAGHKLATAAAGVQHQAHGTAGRMNLRRVWAVNHRIFMHRWRGYLRTRTFGHPGEPR